MTREEKFYRDHAFAFYDYYVKNWWGHARPDGTVKHYTKKTAHWEDTKKFTRSQVYNEFLKSL